MTEAERAVHAARMAQMAQVRAERRKETAAWLERLDAITDPLARVVLDLHARTKGQWDAWHTCPGCDVDGYEAEQPPWPCGTVYLVAAHLGIPVPEFVELEDA